MAKGKNDIILRDRMQMSFDANGDIATLYGRVDLSDYVSIPKKDGLNIKEVRFQMRNPNQVKTGSFNQNMVLGVLEDEDAFLKIYATTTAYETAVDVGIGSPNVLAVVEHQTYFTTIQESGANVGGNLVVDYFEFGVPDLHPEGYPVVTDLLIGIAATNCTQFSDNTLELDIMIIAEPKKITEKDMELMLTQGQDL